MAKKAKAKTKKTAKTITAREALRARIEPLLAELQEPDEPTGLYQQLIGVIVDISDALDALDLGLVPEAFEPAATPAHRGSDQVRIRYLRRKAVAYVKALRTRGNSAKDARIKVGVAYGVSDHAVRQEGKRYTGKEAGAADRVAVKVLFDYMRTRKSLLTEDQLLAQAKIDGQQLKLLRTPPVTGT